MDFEKIESPYSYSVWKFIFTEPREEQIKYLNLNKVNEKSKYFLKYLILPKSEMIKLAVQNGEINLLKLLKEYDFFINRNATIIAVKYNRLECLIWLHKNGFSLENILTYEAAYENNFECLKYLVENGCQINPACSIAPICKDSLECLIYVDENTDLFNSQQDQYFEPMFVNYCAIDGSLKCLKYFHEKGFKWDEKATLSAAKKGNFECLEYLVNNKCPINIEKCLEVCGNLKIKNYLLSYKNGRI